MPLPGDWSQQDQYRAANMDRELQGAMRTIRKAVLHLDSLKKKFVALNLSTRWPTLATDYVHGEPDASTRGEQTDISNIIAHFNAVLLNEGASPLTAAQAAAIINRYGA